MSRRGVPGKVLEDTAEEAWLPQKVVSLWSVVEIVRAFLHGSIYQWVEDGFELFERKPDARVFGLGFS